MEVYRLVKTKYAYDLTGTGARTYGGRWNHKDTEVIYTSASRALATLECLVHVSLPLIPRVSTVTLQIPDNIIAKEIPISTLPKDWQQYPSPVKLADIGTVWATSKETLLLRVPSATVPDEYNFLINPLHTDIKYVSITNVTEFIMDGRLLRLK